MDDERFASRSIRFASGAGGRRVTIASGNPRNYHQLVSAPGSIPPVEIDGLLFLPPADAAVPLVIVVPGSLAVAPSHLRHAEAAVDAGWAAFVLDPFGARDVTSTIADQTQFSFAASAYDVMRTVVTLSQDPAIDATRIALQGHSRGGTAVQLAASTALNAGVLGPAGASVRAVLAAYPWCGHQPVDPDIGTASLRVLIGDRDDWCSAQQAQGYVNAVRLRGGDASIRIIGGAGHSFDRDTPVELLPAASVSPAAPTAYLAADGSFVHPLTGEPDPSLVDRDLMVYALKAGYGVRGAHIGGTHEEAVLFRDEQLAFFGRALG